MDGKLVKGNVLGSVFEKYWGISHSTKNGIGWLLLWALDNLEKDHRRHKMINQQVD